MREDTFDDGFESELSESESTVMVCNDDGEGNSRSRSNNSWAHPAQPRYVTWAFNSGPNRSIVY
jgi:hypothetical protein